MPRMLNPLSLSASVIEAVAAAAARPQQATRILVPTVSVPVPAFRRRPTTQATPLPSATCLQALRHAAPPHLVSSIITIIPLPHQRQQRRSLSSSSSFLSKMATESSSDEQYMAFLDKANRDVDDARATATATAAQGGSRPQPFHAMDAESEIPKVIRDVIGEAVYMSEADELFEGVSLRWSGEGGLPDEDDFAKLIHHWDPQHAEIEIMDPSDWDPQGEYVRIVDAVSEATKGNDVRVYRVVRDVSRVDYWVVSRDDSEGRLVGVKALGVES